MSLPLYSVVCIPLLYMWSLTYTLCVIYKVLSPLTCEFVLIGARESKDSGQVIMRLVMRVVLPSV